MMDHAYPDFGFEDPLGYELREACGETDDMQRTYTIWEYLLNYVTRQPKFERFNNLIDKLAKEKNNEML